jgi:molecular chaperone GrpE
MSATEAEPQQVDERSDGPDKAGRPVDVGTLVAENASLRERLLRALADAENTRRRAERSTAEARQYAISDLARELLGIADNLQRAIEAAGQQTADADPSLIEGVRATERMLEQLLERFGIRKIEALGQAFDPNRHEAVMQVDDAERPPGTVAQVIQDGYTIHDRLLRPARVIVSRRTGPSSQSDA